MELSRRDALKLSGMGLGGLVLGSSLSGCPCPEDTGLELERFCPGEPLDENSMRISFMGTSFLPRIKQECNSVFVELGNGDCFVFDCGSGVSAKYTAMGITPYKMDKVFLTHLHGDHMSDIITIYCFGPSQDRKTPLHIFGPSADDPAEGTAAFCNTLKALTKWHTESFSFLPTGLNTGAGDGYDLIAHELPYMNDPAVGDPAVAYADQEKGVTIWHFPAVHARSGSISYRLEWNGLSMVFSGDTKPNDYMIRNAQNLDVLIHEMVVPPEVWAAKNSGLTPDDGEDWTRALRAAEMVQDSSHTPQKALGYILSQTNPRLGVPTHFQVNDDTVGPALDDIRLFYDGPVTIATDLLVLDVSKDEIRQRRAKVSDWAWYPAPHLYPAADLATPRYPEGPLQQLNDELLGHVIQPILYDPQLPPTA